MDDWEILTEATIDAIRVEPMKKEVRIDVTCRWQGEERKQIVAKGVDDFVVNEMRLTNIIDRVTRFDVDVDGDSEKEAARRLFLMMRGHEPSVRDLESPVLLEKLSRIRAGSLILMEIEPVYGATVIILATGFKIESMDMP